MNTDNQLAAAALVLAAALFAVPSTCTAGDVYTPPKTWKGTKIGSTDGNPARVNGVPMWRFDGVVHPDLMPPPPVVITQPRANWAEPLHYTPLTWGKNSWRIDWPQYQGANVNKNGDVVLGAYGCGAHETVGEFPKNNALVFIAPKDGKYALSATIDIHRWEGQVRYALVLHRRLVRNGAVRFLKLKDIPLEIKKGNEVKVEGIDLRKGAELVILPRLAGYHCGASATFRGLRITRADIPGGYRETLGRSRQPASRPKAPMAKGNAAGINFPLCTQPVTATLKEGRYPSCPHAGHPCMGVIDVTKPPYHADNTGKTDVSDVLTRALQENNSSSWGTRVIYLPDGVYMVTKTVMQRELGLGPCLHGQSRKGTIIRLKDGTWPKNDGKRHWVLKTGGGKAQNFNRNVRNLTISIGRNNDGACGMFFIGNNQASMSDIDIVSEDGKGQIGLDLHDGGEQGPSMVRNTFVKGFRIGLVSDALDAVTIHNLRLEGQREVGIQHKAHPLWIYGLTSVNRVPVLSIGGDWINSVLVNAKLTGGAEGVPAIKHNSGMLFVRNLSASGYGKAIESTAKGAAPPPPGLAIAEYSSGGKGASLFGPPKGSLNLPVKEPPEPAWEQDMTRWASVEWYKREGLTDAEAMQAAIDDDRNTTICVPAGVKITGPETVYVRGNISRIMGTGGSLTGEGSLAVVDGGPPVVKIERMGLPKFYQRSDRTVVIEAVLSESLHHEGSG
ncbi:MAG TPA: glycosyl hydrolase family 28-related protein, partial [Phycisphaerae bacterium]|nr:glycosyl hydrolase family 28-related protein [Phycisphaerae bacterium]